MRCWRFTNKVDRVVRSWKILNYCGQGWPLMWTVATLNLSLKGQNLSHLVNWTGDYKLNVNSGDTGS